MNTKTFFVLLLFAAGISLSCSSEDDNFPTTLEDTTPLDAAVFFNVSYGDHQQEVYDLYLPANRSAETTKVLVLIHGGGWTGGDKEDMNDFVSGLQQTHPNHAIVNINYVLATLEIPAFPHQFLDIEAVLEKLTLEREALQILPEFGLIGTSAGAHLAMMYDAVYDSEDQVKFVANIVGPSDLTDPFYANNPNYEILLALLIDETAYPPITNYNEVISPVYQLTSSASPAVMFYGSQDPLVPLSNGVAIDEAYTNAQINHSYTVYEGGHGKDWSEADFLNLRSQISTYINTYLLVQ